MDPKLIIFPVVFGCAFIVMPSLVLRYRRLELRHRERMVAFDKGIPIPPDPPETAMPTNETYFLRGLIWLAAGIGLSFTLLIMTPMFAGDIGNDFRVRNMRDLGYTKEEIGETLRAEDLRRTRGLAALGIVPSAVGVAYLFFYYEQRKRRTVKME